MKEYVLIFRMDITGKHARPSTEQMQRYMESWAAWIGSIVAKGQLAEGGNHLSREGVLIRSNGKYMNSPYLAGHESVAGYIIIHARNMEDAVGIAQECPILEGEGTSVEIRETATPG
jgi:hypothetical protein